MSDLPVSYSSRRASLGFDEIQYGLGGIELVKLAALKQAQEKMAEDPAPWNAAWMVIGHETACGDPLFFENRPPYRVLTAMAGEPEWIPKSVAATLEAFWECLEAFRAFAQSKISAEDYLRKITSLCDGDEDAIDFWFIQAEIGMDEA